MTTSLSPSASEAVASYSSVLSSIAQASRSAVSSIAELEGDKARPGFFKIVGILLAVGSGLLIGSSFVFKKKGLIASQAADPARKGEGHAYLKSPMWWCGMTLMIIGEICNFVAYAFADAILVTPLGALSVVICAILSSIFLKERLTLFGKIGCGLSIVGSTIIALNGPEEQTVSTIAGFQKLFLAPGFLVFGSVVIICALILVFFVAPKFGKKNMLVYIGVCSLIGGISVSCTQGLGAAIVTSIGGNNQFKSWFIYFLLVFVIVTLLTEINYLNKALELFNTAMVTAIYYVLFTFATLVTSVILYQGFKAPVTDIITVVLGFGTICCGITLLQMSKIDPEALQSQVNLDRRTTILLAASRGDIEPNEKHTEGEDPGMDAIRGSAGVIGSIYRARSARRSMMSADGSKRRRNQQTEDGRGVPLAEGILPRHQLYDRPMPLPDDALERVSLHSKQQRAMPTINFAEGVTAYRYPPPGDTRPATHEHHDIGEAQVSPSYRDPYANDPLSPSSPRQPHSAVLPSSDTSDTLRTRMNRFSSTPDLSLQDPRGSVSGKKQKMKEFFASHQLTGGTASTKRSIRSKIKEDDDNTEEMEGLVTSPLNERNSMDEPWESGSDISDDGSPRDLEAGPRQPHRDVL